MIFLDVDEREREAAVLIPGGSSAQSTFRDLVCENYGGGFPIAEAVVLSAEQVRRTDPWFEPRFDPELLTIDRESSGRA
jgi:hypothetical protein